MANERQTQELLRQVERALAAAKKKESDVVGTFVVLPNGRIVGQKMFLPQEPKQPDNPPNP